MQHPLISVIIPTYNRAAWLREAIDSVLSQSARMFELIIVDDGSTDQTREFITEYGDQVHYLYQTNQGVSRARNLGSHSSHGI